MEEIRLGDVVQMRKAHPCGSSQWIVTRTGADIKIKCCGCDRIVMMDRVTFLKRRKKLISAGPAVNDSFDRPKDTINSDGGAEQ